MQWSVRNLLNPVVVRCLNYGVSPVDLEYVMQQVEKQKIVNSKVLEETWMNEWEKKAAHYSLLGQKAKKKRNLISVREYYDLVTKCYYASYLVNSDSIENKRSIYKKLEANYKETMKASDYRFERIKIPMGENCYLPAYLHLPEEKKFSAPYSCVIIFAGMGSCKEELETLARPLVERGLAVLACDQPGTGDALFLYNLKLDADLIETGFSQMWRFIKFHPLLNQMRTGTYGLCMGGGYAYRMAAEYADIKCCVNLFPLFISLLDENSIPRWMKVGTWAEFQTGTGDSKAYIEKMSRLSEGCVKGDYLLVHSEYDNWMKEEQTYKYYEKATGYKEHIQIEGEPAYADKEAVMHTMPVGEQLHWLKYLAADWFVEHLSS